MNGEYIQRIDFIHKSQIFLLFIENEHENDSHVFHLVICSSRHSFGFTLYNIALVTALATISFMKLHVGLKPMRLTSKNINVNILKNLLSKINEFLQLNSGN